MSFRRRGVAVAVDTTGPAELDFQLFGVPEKTITLIGQSLERLPVSSEDFPHGPLLRRTIEGYLCYFLLATAQEDLVVVLLAVRPVDEPETIGMKELLISLLPFAAHLEYKENMTVDEYQKLTDRQKWEMRLAHAFAIVKAHGYTLVDDQDATAFKDVNAPRRDLSPIHGKRNVPARFMLSRLSQKRVARAKFRETENY